MIERPILGDHHSLASHLEAEHGLQSATLESLSTRELVEAHRTCHKNHILVRMHHHGDGERVGVKSEPEPRTGPGFRLKALLTSPLSHASVDEAAAFVVGAPEASSDAAIALREALRAELTMFNGGDAMWDKVAAGLIAKLECSSVRLVMDK